jgi:Putative transposase/Transposase zinc-binding domain
MLEVADIIRAAGPEVCARLAVLPSQQRALRAIQSCRTPALGGEVYRCEQCRSWEFSYHSCGNRHCPKCHGQQTERWLQKQRARLLPCAHYLLTFTVPSELRALARGQQKLMYGLLLNAASATIQKLCADPQWLGAQVSLLGVLHTWTRAMLYHPHAHFLVSAGGLSLDGREWVWPKNPKFLVPVQALAKIFRAKVRDGIKDAGLLLQVPATAWNRQWVVHAQHAGSGEKVLDYLGRYVFRIAITHSRLEKLEAGQVTFRYRDYRSQQLKRVELSAAEFIQRFLEHVLPKGLAKVRHYGLASAACRQRQATALALLRAAAPATGKLDQPTPASHSSVAEPQRRCPHCRTGRLRWLGELPSWVRVLWSLSPKAIPP